jgi:hypothetical protein
MQEELGNGPGFYYLWDRPEPAGALADSAGSAGAAAAADVGEVASRAPLEETVR